MKFNLPTRERCQEIVKNSEAFYCTEKVVEDQNVELYDYRLASISDFVDNDAFELRGLTFVQLDNGEWRRELLMQKFFNYGQTLGWMPEDLDNKKIASVANKEDGSIISFVKFSNGKVRAKSKMSFESEQAVMAQELYDNHPILLEFIEECMKLNKTPIFELVGYNNCIVLNYSMPSELRLLQVRDNETGEYWTRSDIDNLTKSTGIKVTKTYNLKELEKVASKYTEDEARTKIGDRKFQGLQAMIVFLSKN